MNAFEAPEIDWAVLSPVLVVLAAGVVGVLVEAFVPDRVRRTTQVVLTLAALAGSLSAVVLLWDTVATDGYAFVVDGTFLLTPFTLGIQAVVAILAILGVLVIADRTRMGEDAFAPTAAAVPGTRYEDAAREAGLQQTEIYPLVLFATGGMLLFPATDNLIVLFIALEVLSLPLYVLCATARRRRLLSQEAAFKYFLLGSFASAIMLFGIALVYGFAGTVSLEGALLALAHPESPVLELMPTLVIAGNGEGQPVADLRESDIKAPSPIWGALTISQLMWDQAVAANLEPALFEIGDAVRLAGGSGEVGSIAKTPPRVSTARLS